MYFQDDKHKQNFNVLLNKVDKVDSKEYKVACYVLSLPELFRKASKYISLDGIDYAAMLDEQDFSSSYKWLVNVSNNLFNYSNTLDLSDYLRLDEELYQVFLQALEIRRA